MYIRVYNYSMQIRSYNTNLYTWNPNDICFGQLQQALTLHLIAGKKIRYAIDVPGTFYSQPLLLEKSSDSSKIPNHLDIQSSKSNKYIV